MPEVTLRADTAKLLRRMSELRPLAEYAPIFKLAVYVAGPYSSAPQENVRRALKCAERLHVEGFAPYVPHLTLYWDMHYPHPYEFWMDLDKAYLARCDCVYRFTGPSPGADVETALAARLGIPVYITLSELKRDKADGVIKSRLWR